MQESGVPGTLATRGRPSTALTGHLLLLLPGLLGVRPEAGVAALCAAQLPADLVQALLQGLLALLVRRLGTSRGKGAVRVWAGGWTLSALPSRALHSLPPRTDEAEKLPGMSGSVHPLDKARGPS